jgi:hypothetical protein
MRGCGLHSSGSGWALVTDSCGHPNDTNGFIKGRNFLDSCGLVSLPRKTVLHGVMHFSLYVIIFSYLSHSCSVFSCCSYILMYFCLYLLCSSCAAWYVVLTG